MTATVQSRPARHHLVAGGGGFVGSHLVDLLLARGDTATIVDNFVTGRRSNIAHLRSATTASSASTAEVVN